MKKFLVSFAVAVSAIAAHASPEKITIMNAQGPQQGMTAQYMRIVDEANAIQNEFQFLTDFRQGGFESIAVKAMLQEPKNRLATITNSVVEGMSRGLVDESSIAPVFSFGDSCWAVISTLGEHNRGIASIGKNTKEITGGGPAPGGAAHITALEIGAKQGIPTRYIVYKSNIEALVNMVGDEKSVNIVLERAQNYVQLKDKNPNVKALAVSCPHRISLIPAVPTLQEQGIKAPYIWNFLIASKDMPVERRQKIERIFIQATKNVGREKIVQLSDVISPIWLGTSSVDHYNQSIAQLKQARQQWENQINANK